MSADNLDSLNSISRNSYFIKTSLYKSFQKSAFGFIDAGTADSIHSLILPVASLAHCVCFEADEDKSLALLQKYTKEKIFSKIDILNVALGGGRKKEKLYFTKSPVNTSIFKPAEELILRYNASGFKVTRVGRIKTESLDSIVLGLKKTGVMPAEFIKLDCQAAEFDILTGASRILNSGCVALLLEVEFFEMYRNQKTFSDIDNFLKKKGFQLYGIYPNYISAKKLDRRVYDSEERIMWADVLYFKDPLSSSNKLARFSKRNLDAVLLSAILTHFYDFALEITGRYYRTGADAKYLKKLIFSLAEKQKKNLEEDIIPFVNELRKAPKRGYLLAKKFIDRHKSNNNVNFLTSG